MLCTCHSLALCVEHAFEEIPGNISVMLADVPAHFSRSSLRREAYIDLFTVMNDDKPGSSVFTKFCATRWAGRNGSQTQLVFLSLRIRCGNL